MLCSHVVVLVVVAVCLSSLLLFRLCSFYLRQVFLKVLSTGICAAAVFTLLLHALYMKLSCVRFGNYSRRQAMMKFYVNKMFKLVF